MRVERCQAPNSTRPMSRLPIIVSYTLISLKAHSILLSILTHTSIHLAINMASIIPKALTYIYHGNSHQAQHTSIMHIISSHPRQQTTRYHKGKNIDMTTSKKHVIAFQTSRTHHPTKHVQLIIKYISNACLYECMTYLAYFSASQHLYIYEWTCECMFMVLKQEKKRKPNLAC